MLSRVFTSSALLKEPSRAAHALNAIGLSANVAIIFGVNPMFLVNVSRVGFESAGTCSGFGAAVLAITSSPQVTDFTTHSTSCSTEEIGWSYCRETVGRDE